MVLNRGTFCSPVSEHSMIPGDVFGYHSQMLPASGGRGGDALNVLYLLLSTLIAISFLWLLSA